MTVVKAGSFAFGYVDLECLLQSSERKAEFTLLHMPVKIPFVLPNCKELRWVAVKPDYTVVSYNGCIWKPEGSELQTGETQGTLSSTAISGTKEFILVNRFNSADESNTVHLLSVKLVSISSVRIPKQRPIVNFEDEKEGYICEFCVIKKPTFCYVLAAHRQMNIDILLVSGRKIAMGSTHRVRTNGGSIL